ncbi:MAG TPA: dipeptidase [Thermoanaerobaculia bacterium]|nr:dipeptidase [Thermoanaerobaculia bacterium]
MKRRDDPSLPGAVLAVLLLAAAAAGPAAGVEPEAVPEPPSQELVERARAILSEVPLIDGHNDAPWQYRERAGNRVSEIDLAADTSLLEPPMHTDIPRLRTGGVGAQFWSVYVPVSMAGPGAPAAVLEQIDVVYRMARRYPETFEMAYTADDVRRIFAEGRIASLIGVEGGHGIHDSLAVLRQLYRAGARYMTLTHSANTRWADACTDAPEHGGLTPFGVEVVKEMNRLGMLVDLSHVSAEAMHDALDASEAPVVFSHSSARAVTGHPRNVPDDVLRRLPETGGVVMVTFVQPFVSDESWRHWAERAAERARLEALHPGDPEAVEEALERWNEEHPAPRATYLDVADHVDHVREVAGIDHVGIGSDFDGIGQGPLGLEGVGDFPVLFAELLRRGWSEEDLKKLAGENALRVLDRAEEVAARLQRERPPSEASIEELDGGAGDPAAGAAAGSSL